MFAPYRSWDSDTIREAHSRLVERLELRCDLDFIGITLVTLVPACEGMKPGALFGDSVTLCETSLK